MKKRNPVDDEINHNIVFCIEVAGAITVAVMVAGFLEIFVFRGIRLWLYSITISSFFFGLPVFFILSYCLPKYLHRQKTSNSQLIKSNNNSSQRQEMMVPRLPRRPRPLRRVTPNPRKVGFKSKTAHEKRTWKENAPLEED